MFCLRCLNPQLKEALLREVVDPAIREAILLLEDCRQGVPLELETGRRKRRPSAYQEFMGRCLREAGIKDFGSAAQAMKACAAEWRNRQTGG